MIELPDDSLITAHEVIENAPADAHSDANERCKYIVQAEEKLFICFGMPFYQRLLEDRVVYAPAVDALPDAVGYIAFTENNAFSAGNHVLFQSTIYKVLRDTEPGIYPGNTLYFSPAPKFKTPHFEFLWQRYLKRIIAFSVLHKSIMYRFIRDTNKGVVKPYDEGVTRAATLKELQAYKGEARTDISDLVEIMETYISANRTHFPDYIGNLAPLNCGTTNCNISKTKRRGFVLGRIKR